MGNCGDALQILYMRSAWHVRGRTVATFSFHSKPEFEDRQRAILPTQGTFDFENQPYPTQRYLMLFVAAVCVYDKQAGKVLIAKRTKGNPPGQRGTHLLAAQSDIINLSNPRRAQVRQLQLT